MNVRALVALTLAVLLVGSAPAVSSAGTAGGGRDRWDTRVFAHVASPGFPAFVYVHPNGRVYAGSYTNPAGDSTPSKVFEWTRDGTPKRSWTCSTRGAIWPRSLPLVVTATATITWLSVAALNSTL